MAIVHKRKMPTMDAADFDSIFGTSAPAPEKKEIPKDKKELAAKITVEEAEAARVKAQAILEGNKKAIKQPILTTKEDIEDKSLAEETPYEEDKKPTLEAVQKAPSDDDFDSKVKEILEKDYGPVTEDMYVEDESEVSARIISNIGTDNEEPILNSEQLKEEQEAKKQEFIANKDLEGLEQYMLKLHVQRSEMLRNAKLKEKIMAEYDRKVKKNATRKRTVAKAPIVETNDTTEEGVYTQEEEQKAEEELQKLEQERLEQLQQEQPKPAKVTKVEKPKSTPKKAVSEPQQQEEFKLPFDDGLSIEEAVTALMQDYMSEDFVKWQQDILNALAEIRIDPDINAGTMKFKLSQIDALRAELIGTRLQAKATLNTLMNKEYGMIAAYIAQNSAGSNADERKKAGYTALESYRNSEGKRINLLKFFTGVRMRAEFIETVIDELENKQRMLITYSSSIKIDAQLTQ